MASRCAWLSLVAHGWLAAVGVKKCTLASLTLKYEDWPIDLDTSFQPYITEYTAKLDFSMHSFSINVRPDTGCEVDRVPDEPIPVKIGDTEEVTFYARHPETGDKQEYTVTVSRLLGSETELESLEVEGGVMRPVFDPKVRTYQVHLDLGYDEVQVVYRLYDNEQRIRISAQEQHPTGEEAPAGNESAAMVPAANHNVTNVGSGDRGTGSTEKSDSEHGKRGGGSQGAGEDERDRAEKGGGRRLGARSSASQASTGGTDSGALVRRLGGVVHSGEAQLRKDAATFMLDVGFSRALELTVQCADATQASIGTYKLKVARQGCGPKRPYFDPEKRFCVNFCSAGFYRNRETHRCSHCNTNCRQCTGLLECSMCMPDTTDYTYTIQPDGKCRANPNHLFKKYRWWCIGLGILFVFLVLFGCAGICQLCCTSGGGRGKHQKLSTYDSDSDDGMAYVPGQRLAMY